MQAEAFLRRHPPFDTLAPEALERVARTVQVEFFHAGQSILEQGGAPARFVYVVRTGAVELVDGGHVLDLLGEGEAFGYPSLLSGLGPAFDVRAHEDTLCYLVDPAVAAEVFGTPSGLTYLMASVLRRERRSIDTREVEDIGPSSVSVAGLLRRRLVTCEPTTSIRDAASLMTAERVSSLLVLGDGGPGILTDRDLRSRVLADGVHPDRQVREVMTTPVVTAKLDETVDDVLRLMLERGFHHVPIADGVEIVGVVSDSDVLGLDRNAPFLLRRAIERATNAETVVGEVAKLRSVVVALVDAEVDPVDVGHVIATTVDAATRQLIDLAVAALGEPPAAWAWLALGSQARHEQALSTDQDHALIYDPREVPRDEADRYFFRVAERVTDGLEAAGIPPCEGRVMAVDPYWRRPMDEFVREFRDRLADPSPSGKVFTSIALDYRRLAGGLNVESALDGLMRNAAADAGFLRRLGRTATELRPPTGFVRNLVAEARGSNAGALDVKHGGITPITNLARTYALRAGLTGNRTVWRLRESAQAGAVSTEVALGLEEAFRLLWRVRLRHQAGQVREGRTPDDDVDPASLGPLARRGLKEAFRVIATAQRSLASDLGLRIL